MPTNINYSCYIKAVEFVIQSYGVHKTSLVINSLGVDTYTHTDFLDKSNFKETRCTARLAPKVKMQGNQIQRSLTPLVPPVSNRCHAATQIQILLL